MSAAMAPKNPRERRVEVEKQGNECPGVGDKAPGVESSNG